MKVPVQVTVGGKKVKIEYPDELPDNCSGEMVCHEHCIRIAKSRHKTERQVFNTLYHELCHYAFEVTGHSAVWTDAQEEPLVYALELMMADLFVFAPDAKIKWKEVTWLGEDE